MNQALDMKVNRLPSRTWNWLHMNEAVIDQVMVENENKVTITLPENISQGNITEIDFGKIATGMGEDMDKLASEAHISSLTFETEKDTKIQQPLRLAFHYKDRDRQMNTVDLHIQNGSEATVIMDYSSEKEAEGLAVIRTKIMAEKDSRLNLVQVQRLERNFECMNDVGIQCEDNASVQVFHLILGGRNIWQGCRADLIGRESRFQGEIGYLAGGSMHLDMNYVIRHFGRDTICDISSSGVLKDHASKLFRGTIDFVKGCAGSKGNEKEDVLLLDDDVKNQTIPVILCAEEDVEGNHGATIGQLDEELLFYLRSRGLSEEYIYEMLAKARIDAVCSKIPDMQIREEISHYLEGGETDEQ